MLGDQCFCETKQRRSKECDFADQVWKSIRECNTERNRLGRTRANANPQCNSDPCSNGHTDPHASSERYSHADSYTCTDSDSCAKPVSRAIRLSDHSNESFRDPFQ